MNSRSAATVPKSLLTILAENTKKCSHLSLHSVPLLINSYLNKQEKQAGRVKQLKKRELILQLKIKKEMLIKADFT